MLPDIPLSFITHLVTTLYCMHIYFIRHGETAHNAKHLHQPETTPLDERGKEQARAVAPIVARYQPEKIFCSTLTRAEETAQIIGKEVGVFPEHNVLFCELSRPAHIVGKRHFGLASLWYMMLWFFKDDEAYWKAVGGESRKGFLLRLREAKHYLETQKEYETIAVVSHSVFITFFTEHICNERPIGFFRAALVLLKIKQLDNSSISHVVYDPHARAGTCAWSIVAFDDDAHVKKV